jgi:hypothetical protein
VPPGSQLAAIFGKGGENIHKFYQDGNNAIQHLKYVGEEWRDSSEVRPKKRSSEERRTESRTTESPRAQQGSSLAVVSTGDPEDSDLRLYYQLENGKIQELFTDSKNKWTACMFIVPYLPLAMLTILC